MEEKNKFFPGNNFLLNHYPLFSLNTAVLVPEQNIKVCLKHCTVTKDTFGPAMCILKLMESTKHVKLVLPFDPDWHFAFLSPVFHPVSFYITCLWFWLVGLYIDRIAHIYLFRSHFYLY